MRDILQGSTKGLNGTVLAYGQTGSGKTFTISGSPSNFNYRGIIPRGITRIFQEIGGKPEYDFVVKIAYLEIYNETVFDLLSPLPTFEQKGEITFQEDSRGNVTVKGLTKHVVNNEEEARLTKEHNMANVMALSEKIENLDKVLDAYLNTEYSKEERHKRRVKEIEEVENNG